MKKLVSICLALGLLTPLFAQGYIQPTDNFHHYQVTHQRSTLPSSYDSRDYGWVLAPRDQLQNGTCWAFSCATAWQILAHKNNLITGYLSAQSIATCFEGYLLAPIKGGGNTRVANSMLVRLEGLVSEEAVPYNPENTNCVQYEKKDVPTYVLGWNYLPEDDQIAIKEHIMESGAVSASIYFTSSSYNATTKIYNYQGNMSSNHAVTLIGWDDSKQAWFAQNTWGEGSFYGGYLWISYADSNVGKQCTAYTDLTPVNSIDNVHHITSAGMVGGYGYKENVISDGIIEYDFADGEQLVAIGTGITSGNVRINFTVLDRHAGKILYASEPITVPYAGFYKHELPTPLDVTGKICIAVTYLSESDIFVIPIEYSVDNLYSITPHAGNQWIDFYETGNWMPMGTSASPYNLCIYAYTKNKTTAVEQTPAAQTTVFTGTGIASNAWESAKCIHVYGMDGKKYKTLQPADDALPNLVTGVYLLAIEKLDGTSYTEKIWIQ